MRRLQIVLMVAFFSITLCTPKTLVFGQNATPKVEILNSDGKELLELVDGDEIRLSLILAEITPSAMEVKFVLAGSELAVASCVIPEGGDRCQSELTPSLGWYWDEVGNPMPKRIVEARMPGLAEVRSNEVGVIPRPVVMVHGFNSSWEAWTNYLGADGYLASVGLSGYAVGDGQVAGMMDTGRLDQPDQRTNTIAENAAILGEYIANVKTATGASKVDLLAHSMGGLISRYYIDRVMRDVDVAQLIMLGSPMAGSDCANLPAALGFYLPATIEIRPAYIQGVFNQQITHRRGVQFHALAGVPLVEPFQSPCTPVPSDLVVSKESVRAIPVHFTQMKTLHTELNTSREVFEQYVMQRLQAPADGFAREEDPFVEGKVQPELQFTRVYTGHLELGAQQVLTIQIDPGVVVASFALFDSSRSLDVRVQGVSGNVIELDPVKNGLIKVQDPSSLLYLGYGFNQPKPGAWVVTLLTTDQTPPAGADYALTATYQGGAILEAGTDKLLPQTSEAVEITARLKLGEQVLAISTAEAVVRGPDGKVLRLDLGLGDGSAKTTLNPDQAGLYDIQVNVSGQLPDGGLVERTAFLVVQVQPDQEALPGRGLLARVLVGLVVGGAIVFLILMIVMIRALRRRKFGRKKFD